MLNAGRLSYSDQIPFSLAMNELVSGDLNSYFRHVLTIAFAAYVDGLVPIAVSIAQC